MNQQQATQQVTVTLDIDGLNKVLAALDTMQHGQVRKLFDYIMEQANGQLKAQELSNKKDSE